MPQRSNVSELADDDSDSISLTSVDDEVHDPDTEFVVEDIHCERVDPDDGILKYLVEWSNFPLHECTWEPESEISEILKELWEEKKAKQDPRVAEEYERKYEEAFNKVLNERRELHRRRNAKRRRLGLEETEFCFRRHIYPDSGDDAELMDGANKEPYIDSAAPAGSDSDSEEAQEDSTINHKAEIVVKTSTFSYQTKTQASTRPNRILSVDPSSIRAKSDAAGHDKNLSRQRPPATTPTGTPLFPPKVRSNSGASIRQRDERSITVYQGSARRASTGAMQSKPAPVRGGSSGNASAKPPTGTSTLAKKGLTAKKSGKAPIAATNIFIGGKKRQPRQNLASAMVDTNKDPKLFKLHRFRRKAELRSREHDDQAPDVSKLAGQLFNISQIPPPRQTSAQNTKQSGFADADANPDGMSIDSADEVETAGVRRSSTSASEPKSALLKRSSFDFDPENSKKRVKTVRFTGEDGVAFMNEPVGLDELPEPTNRIRSPPPPPGSPSPPPEPKTKLSLATYHSRIMQNVEKKITMATGNRSLHVTFHDIPKDSSRETGQQWLREFCGADSLHFGHTVLAESIVAQLSQLRGQDPYSRHAHDVLCHGKVTSVDGGSLEVLAEQLRVSHSGIFTSHENYNLIIYPTRCEGFHLSALGIESLNTPGVALRHFIFRSSHNISRLIRPSSATPDQVTQASVGKGQETVFRSLLGMRYGKLTAGPHEKKDHHFFLVFPDAAVDWYRSISCWLYTCNPHCKIYTSFDRGSWSAFLEKAYNQCGVVVIHETAVDFVRRFPFIAELLQTDNNYNFWRFSATMGLQQAQSSAGSSRRLTPDVFSRIFPMGKAILVTPSFLVCEPQKTLQLFDWFFGNQTLYSSNKLVTAYNIVDFLRDLAGEANRLQTRLKQRRWMQMSELEAADERNALGLSDQDLIARGKAWAMAEDWLSVSMERNGVFSEENHVIFADRCIDPNDEQSLVNWFGWWSLVKVDKFRKFYVLGSGPAVKQTRQNGAEQLSRACRSVPVPIYDSSVVNDPNEALRAVLKKNNDPEDGLSAGEDGRKIGRVPTVSLQSQIFANNDLNIQHFLREKDRVGSIRIYGFPVSWVDFDMADHFGDPTLEFATLKQWFAWPYPWLGDSHQSFNTYISFFYTIEEDWDPSKFPRGLKPKRHPWLVVYRPWEPHVKWEKYRHGKMELIFWDVRAGYELETSHSLQLSDLNWMQREVVKFVQAHGAEKNPGSRVDRVWLGGFRAHQQQLVSTLPADMTAEFLESLSVLPRLKRKLPSSDGFMRQNGWREVSLVETPVGPRAGLANTSASSRYGTDNGDSNEGNKDTRIIFHPPRGSAAIGAPRSSRCTNDLFEQARLARLRNGNTTSMSFTFKPTMEWYADLVAEGRQYEHIYVNRWEKVFDQLKVGQRKTRQAGAASRMSSVSSSNSSPIDNSPG